MSKNRQPRDPRKIKFLQDQEKERQEEALKAAALASSAEVNPLSATNPLAGSDDEVKVDTNSTEFTLTEPVNEEAADSQDSDSEELEEEIEESDPVSPDLDYDPEADPEDENFKGLSLQDSFEAEIDLGTIPEVKPEIVKDPPSKVNHLGNPALPEFNPQDMSKGFYQGIDPQTGKRVFSK